MHLAELKLAVEHRLPILFLLLSDAAYGSIAVAVAPERRRSNVLSFASPSWHRAAEAVGCKGESVMDAEGLRDAAQAWRSEEGPRFIEASFDPVAYLTMTQDLR
jgi:thiamine pyrophosphate-dependent acetolactate synthase large subunit-like protein